MNPLSLIVEADFEAFVDAIPDAVAIVDERGRIVLVNAQTEELFGYAATELTGQPMAQMIGSSRETVTRTLAAFKKGHLVEQNGATFNIHDRMALESMVPARRITFLAAPHQHN